MHLDMCRSSPRIEATVGPVSSVGRASDFTVHNRVMAGLSPSWDRWSFGWKYHRKVGFMSPLTLHTKELKSGTGQL